MPPNIFLVTLSNIFRVEDTTCIEFYSGINYILRENTQEVFEFNLKNCFVLKFQIFQFATNWPEDGDNEAGMDALHHIWINFRKISSKKKKMFIKILFFVSGIEPNFEDLDLVVDQAVDEKVDIDQADPHSNNIHVAHNNPKNR